MPAKQKTSDVTELAKRLIVRHLRVSIPDDKTNTRRRLQRHRIAEPWLEQRVRCVAIVGAGASAPLLGRGDELADDLEDRFGEEKAYEEELFRLQRVYGLDDTSFETRIAALSRTPEATQRVREAISKAYAVRHPTVLGNELLAHLLKHRFLDAIISFNFDELLDQSLDDEIGQNAYRRLVSDRDCSGVVTNADAPDYLPLYIKLHGTATEPDSLRLTREAYYKLSQLMEVAEALFESERAVVLNAGSAMTGFDLHRLLRIPEQLEIYDLSLTPLSEGVQKKITAERQKPLKDSFHRTEHRDDPIFFLPAEDLKPRQVKPTCDGWLKRLAKEIGNQSGRDADPKSMASLVRFQPTVRHEAVADILGPAATLSRWIKDPVKYHDEYIDYLRKRTILELAFSGAKARGLAQLSWLAVDRCGTYFDLYRKEGRTKKLESWNALRIAGGLDENTSLPDVVESDEEFCHPGARPTLDQGTWALREFVPNLLAAHVIASIGKGERDSAERRLSQTLRQLQKGSEVEIHATDDQVCAKAFDNATTLPTLTSLRIFTAGLFDGIDPDDEVYISCETGEWLTKDKAMIELLSKQNRVEVITAFDFKTRQLQRLYGDRLTLHPLDPWRHNRHMTIVCKGSAPMRAVYFARRLRAPVITPVYLPDPDDAARVKGAFDLMRDAIREKEALDSIREAEASSNAVEAGYGVAL